MQVPANHDHPSHLTAHELAAREPYRAELGGYVRQVPVLEPESYASLLYQLGFERQSVRLQVYAHVLGSRDDVVEWVRGTLLTDYEQRMAPETFARFLVEYRALLATRLGPEQPYFYPFKRILMWARKSANPGDSSPPEGPPR